MLSLRPGDRVPFVDDGPSLTAHSAIAHSTIAELAGLEEHDVGNFPIERGILISIIFHLLLVIAMLTMPRIRPGSKEDLFADLVPQPKDDTPIPVISSETGFAVTYNLNPQFALVADFSHLQYVSNLAGAGYSRNFVSLGGKTKF